MQSIENSEIVEIVNIVVAVINGRQKVFDSFVADKQMKCGAKMCGALD